MTLFPATYYRIDLMRSLRMFSSVFFAVFLPLVMFLIFGASMEWGPYPLESGNGNVAAQVMVSMSVYGAITAVTSQSGSAAVEMQQRWGRQLALTPMRRSQFLASKAALALTIAVLPIIVVFIAGALTGAEMNGALWLLCPLMVLLGALPFALFGIAFGTLFRSESAVGAAGGLLVVFMFLGNLFTPLDGVLLDLSPFTPVWGAAQLSLWPLTEGIAQTMTGEPGTQYAIWQPLANVAVWSLVFSALAWWGATRTTTRR